MAKSNSSKALPSQARVTPAGAGDPNPSRAAHEKPVLTKKDLGEISTRLTEAAFSLLAMHQLAIDAQQADANEWYLIAIREMSRSTFRGLDACIERLTHAPAIGNFATEFSGPGG